MRHTALTRAASLVLVPLALSACTDAESRDASGMADTTAMMDTASMAGTGAPTDSSLYGYDVTHSADFQAPEGMNTAGLDGTVEVLRPQPEMEGMPTPHLRVRLAGLTPGDHAWHVHSGPCGTPAPVQIALTSTADMEGLTNPLIADAGGEASAEVAVPALQDLMLGQGRYSLHVHASGGVDHGGTVACADL